METNTPNIITTYKFPEYSNTSYTEIRTAEQNNGGIWFCVKDICFAANITDPDKTLNKLRIQDKLTWALKEDEDDRMEIELDMISENGLRDFVSRNPKLKTRKLLKWIDDEILPKDRSLDDETENLDQETEYPENVFTFKFHNCTDHKIRTIIKEDGAIWFVAKDVCDTLEIKNSRDAISALDNDEKADVGITDTSSNGTTQRRSVTIISESGLYALIFKSRKPEAKVFRKWITSEVLPQIRKTGSYIKPGQTLEQPSTHQEQKAVPPMAVTEFLQATTGAFWKIDRALKEHAAAARSMKRAQKETAVIVRSILNIFPEARDTVNMIGGITSPSLAGSLKDGEVKP